MTVYYVCKYAPLELIAGYGTDFAALDPLAEASPVRRAAPTQTCADTSRPFCSGWSRAISMLWC